MKSIVWVISAIIGSIVLSCFLTWCVNGRIADTKIQLCEIETGRDILIQNATGNELIDVEQYIAGILPGLVDASADDNYLQAQAVAVRTRVYLAMGDATVIHADELEYQYYSEADYIAKWGKSKYKTIKKRYEQAVISTCGKIIE